MPRGLKPAAQGSMVSRKNKPVSLSDWRHNGDTLSQELSE